MADESDKPTNTEVDGSEITTNWDECTTTFDSMDLKEDLLRGIYAYGFEKPSAIQQVFCTKCISTQDVNLTLPSDYVSFHPK